MLNLILIAIGALIIGLAISYAWWCRLRVIYLRQDLFKLRDELWLVARRRDRLEDKAYSDARDILNWCIRGASFISLPQLISSLIEARMRSNQFEERKTDDSEMQAAIDKTNQELVERLGRYVLRDRFVSGFLLACIALVSLGSTVKLLRFAQMVIDSWRKTQGPQILSASQARLHST